MVGSISKFSSTHSLHSKAAFPECIWICVLALRRSWGDISLRASFAHQTIQSGFVMARPLFALDPVKARLDAVPPRVNDGFKRITATAAEAFRTSKAEPRQRGHAGGVREPYRVCKENPRRVRTHKREFGRSIPASKAKPRQRRWWAAADVFRRVKSKTPPAVGETGDGVCKP